jgi:hypothetical protein
VSPEYQNVSEVSLDRDARRLYVVTAGQRISVEGVDRLYVDSMPWNEAAGTVRMERGRVSVNGNIAAATR